MTHSEFRMAVPLLFLLTAVSLPKQVFNENLKWELISELHRHYHSSCVVLLNFQARRSCDFAWRKGLVRLQKFLAERFILTSSAADYPGHIGSTKNLYVIMLDTENTATVVREIFAQIHPSDVHWLLFIPSMSASAIDLFEDLDIPLDCELLVAKEIRGAIQINEVYHVHESLPLVNVPWGSWHPKSGLQVPSVSLEGRRRNLHGINFIGVALHVPPLHFVKRDSDGQLHAYGLSEDVCAVLAETLNFSLLIQQVPGNSYGVQLSDGSWNGAMGLVANYTANIAVTNLGISQARANVVDYTIPLFKSWLDIYFRTTYESTGKLGVYTSPFHLSLWFCIVACILLTTCYLRAMQLALPESEPRTIEIFFQTLGSFCAQGIFPISGLCSVRVVLWVNLITAVFILMAYNAHFTSVLTVKKEIMPFVNLQELLHDNTYSFGLMKHQLSYDLFKKGEGIMRQIYEKKISGFEKNLPRNNHEGLLRTCEETYAHMSDRRHANLDSLPCDITLFPGYSHPFDTALILPKRSPYRRIINYILQKMMFTGVLHRMRRQWEKPPQSKETIPLSTVTLHDVVALLLVFCTGVLTAVIILFIEILCKPSNFMMKQKLKQYEEEDYTTLQN